jgi:xanthine dehydrogenase accessory factor
MSDFKSIVQAYQHSQNRGETAFLATVVATQGSTYRRAGARMLVTSTGTLTGTVSGGCLEHDIVCHIQQQIQPDCINSHPPFLIAYDTSTDEDLLWGFGLGCNGAVEVLVEVLNPSDPFNPLTFIADCLQRRQVGVLATVFRVEGEVPIAVGAHLMLHPDGRQINNLGEPQLQQALLSDAHTAFQNRQSTECQYLTATGQVHVFMEVIRPPISLIVFGAGRDVVPLVQFARALDWFVTVVDCRSQVATGDRFPMADEIILTRRDALRQHVAIPPATAAVVMTHNYHDDLELLKLLLPSAAQYIGLLGSRQRTAKLWQDVLAWGEIKADRDRLHAPVGLDLGAQTPAEIAIAIVAEIQAVFSQRSQYHHH